VSARKNHLTGKFSVFALKNSLWEVKETAVASPFSGVPLGCFVVEALKDVGPLSAPCQKVP
jgi:hypothetical protein